VTYTPPTPDEFRALLARWSLTGAAAGAALACTERQIRRYAGGQTPVPFAVLYVLAAEYESARISTGDWRKHLFPPAP